MVLANASSRQSQAQFEDNTGRDLFLMDSMQGASLFFGGNGEREES